ncbi:MAG: bifunctional phosphoribosyl-AMP cyclohydrolase/phosphoribosyl-ATP diphosphatase HisIE [SAR202 cluster bacterium]|nr:bifunctional phosphoribosyl-AMP cyclohydrolase/phosphoribosyl-ATP diphosphatase HisIE [Chloroflexota bacterium]MQG19777.1 bifunctional phosphoribosyl-AMP cyclohydrolase/phosphoribosyl-ATP diphosphatase HisIE [SAR202 cluster bacterium]MQG24099.1 bifunctional phosphoribosyl-AMP cyclohydrolase/phosphoribosyl-ATP diphosphatase HisIE [SAR202 cluster bacterium]MQG43889.1 bifunctional phosphoribosyl-AMP cyclohydrolase/phosphoribosyl-ATP diphosphatase HisIE [SAR202 cluster bacterium]|tara:strand:+ start:8870 stop:9478 length:609 start_codon:yes stop_codon:yes gene_type:complete
MKPDFNKYKIIPAIIQNKKTKKILMQGWMNKESFDKTIETKKVWFFSRSKDRLWQKGESSENYLNVEQIKLDCDNDSILIQVTPEGPTCHTLNESCFDNELDNDTLEKDFSLDALEEIIEARKTEMPDNSYTTSLFNEGIKKITKKLGEEASEVIIASLAEKRSDLIYESADLIYHLLVLLANEDISLQEVVDELSSRHNKN